MKLALLHFKWAKPSRHYSCYLYDILKPRVVIELSQLWQTLLTDEKNRDDGKHSRNINDKSLARKRDKAYVQGQSKETLNNQVAALTKQFGLNPAGFALFLTQADDLIEKQFGKGEATYLNAKRLLSDFIAHKNKTTRLKTGYYAVPAAPLSMVSKTNPMRIKEDWVSKGKWITRILKVVLTHWQSATFYQTVNDHPDNQQTALGWLLFSGIVFGGINDKGMLQGWLTTLVLEDLKPFIDNRVVANVRYLSQNFGNERDEHGNIYNAQQICVDLISQLWLISVRQIPKEMRQTLVRQLNLENLFKSTLKPILPAQLKPYGTLDFFLKHASYYWEVMPGVSINQTLVGVLQGVERTTGLQRNDFDNLFFDSFNHPKACYNLTDTSKPSSIKPKDIAEPSLAVQAKIRDADLIHEIKTIFRKKYDKTRLGNEKITLTKAVKLRLQIEDLRRLLATFKHISEQILIGWVISLLTGKKPILTDSVEKYLSAIGYDWLWYTLGEDLLSWEEEDFEVVYEQLLDFKRNEIGIQAINYPAGRLQQLHDFAHEHFGIVKVSVPDTKIERKVRAEWMSPARYQAMLEQLKTYVEPLEAEMVMVLYILAIRTGMRKLELLGVTYQDIENLSSGKPSIIVRPNHHRRLKTDVSMRRIPLYALLTPPELTFVTSYLQANKSHNKQQLMLTLSTTNERLESYLPNRLMNEVLKDIDSASGATTYHFHGFRHTAFSNISLILTADKQLARVLTGFSEAQIDTIRTTLLGDNPVTQLGWNMVAGLAGHISPQRNIEYYNHFLVLAATYELTKADLVMPLTLIKNIANISTQNLIDNKVKVTQLADLSANTSQKTIKLLDLQALLYRRSLEQKHSRSPKNFSFNTKPLAATLEETVEISDELFGYYSINQLIALLGHFDNHVADKDLAKLTKVTPADRKLLKQRAQAIANIKSSRKESRFIKHNGKLSPILIDLMAERRMLRQIMQRAAYFRQHHPEEWQWFIHLITNKITINYASISFKKTIQSLLDLEKFLLIADKIFTLDWCMYASDEPLFDSFDKARITYQPTMQKKPPSKQKRQTNQSVYHFEGLEKFLFDKNLTYKTDKKLTTIHIGIKVKDTQLGNFKYKFSALLRFFVHLVLLQDDRYFLNDITTPISLN